MKPFIRSGVPLIFLSALMAVLSHPAVFFGVRFPDLSFFAFIAFIPFFWMLRGKGVRQQFRLAFLFGVLFYFGSNYWLYTALNTYGRLSPGISFLVLLILVLVLALYFAVIFPLSRFIEKSLKVSSFWILPLAWIAVEYFRARWPLGGFPWGQPGYALASWTSIIQISDLAGVYAVTAWIVWLNLAATEGIAFLKDRTQPLKPVLPRLLFALILILSSLAYGNFRQAKVESALQKAPRLKAALIQGNIPQDEKWIFDGADRVLGIYKSLTHQAVLAGAELVLWPETAYPYEVALDDAEALNDLEGAADELILGTVTYRSGGRLPKGLPYAPLGFPIRNSAVLWKAGEGIVAAYHKQRLVPYGEYAPLKNVLPFVKKLTAQMGEFQRGGGGVLLQDGRARIGPLICYEDIFPDIAVTLVRAGADLLLNLTNDAWYGDSSALPQHLNFSVFRAAEHHRSLLRATNTGMTASIDALGRVRASLPPFTRGFLPDEVAILSDLSFYSKHGDVFAIFCVTAAGIMLFAALVVKVRRKMKSM